MTLGDVVREYRTLHGISQRQFGRMAGLSNSYISMLENNMNTKNGLPITPSLETIKQVADAMDTELDDLLRQLGDIEVDVSGGADAEILDVATRRIMRIVVSMTENQKLALLDFLRATVAAEGR